MAVRIARDFRPEIVPDSRTSMWPRRSQRGSIEATRPDRRRQPRFIDAALAEETEPVGLTPGMEKLNLAW